MAELILNEQTHEYTLGERKLPSVTRILKSAGLVDDRFLTDAGAKRGSYAHKALEYYDLGELDEEALDPQLKPYLQAWKEFRADVPFEIISVEERVSHPTLLYAGTLDRRIQLITGQAVIDIKTGTPQGWHPIQTAMYVMPFIEPMRRYAVYLDDGGRYRMEEHKDRNDFIVAKACISLHHWKKGQGL